MKDIIISVASSLLIVFIITFIVGFIGSINTDYSHQLISLTISATATLLAAIIFMIWGLPIYYLFKRAKINSVSMYSIAGFIPGFILVLFFEPFGEENLTNLMLQSTYCGVIGSIAAISFYYLIAKLRITSSSRRTNNPQFLSNIMLNLTKSTISRSALGYWPLS